MGINWPFRAKNQNWRPRFCFVVHCFACMSAGESQWNWFRNGRIMYSRARTWEKNQRSGVNRAVGRLWVWHGYYYFVAYLHDLQKWEEQQQQYQQMKTIRGQANNYVMRRDGNTFRQLNEPQCKRGRRTSNRSIHHRLGVSWEKDSGVSGFLARSRNMRQMRLALHFVFSVVSVVRRITNGGK